MKLSWSTDKGTIIIGGNLNGRVGNENQGIKIVNEHIGILLSLDTVKATS